MKVDLKAVEEACKELYIRALKILPPDIKQGFARSTQSETDATGKSMLGTMIRNIKVAEETNNLLCQDTGIPIYNVVIGRGVEVDGHALKAAIRRGLRARDASEHPLRSSVVHPVTRKNEHTSCGRLVPVINIDFVDEPDDAVDRDDPEGQRLGEQLVAQDGDTRRRRRRGQDLRHRLRARCGRQDLPADDRRRRRRRHRGSVRASRQSRGDAAARLALRRSRGREARGRALRGRQPARRRSAGPRRRFDVVRRARRNSPRRTSR